MILSCNFEELSALTAGAERVLAGMPAGGVVAPPQAIAHVEVMLPKLTGDISVTTLAEQQALEDAVEYVRDHLKQHMDATIIERYVGAEETVVAFFDYANVLTVLDKVQSLGREMAALIYLMTGAPPTAETARQMNFSD